MRSVTDWSQYGWDRWFAWRPVFILGRWHWLTFVARRQWANKPTKYDYGLLVDKCRQ